MTDRYSPDPDETLRLATDQLLRLASTGAVVELDPDEADALAAFEETALSVEDALESRFDDIAPDPEALQPEETV